MFVSGCSKYVCFSLKRVPPPPMFIGYGALFISPLTCEICNLILPILPRKHTNYPIIQRKILCLLVPRLFYSA
jgi:hypothetical protein